MRAGLTMFESENKIVCDICFHNDVTSGDFVRKLGEFHYDQKDCLHRETMDFLSLSTALHSCQNIYLKRNNEHLSGARSC